MSALLPILAPMLLGLLGGCEIPPRYVEESAQVDAFLARSSYRSACVGLKAQDADVRTYAASRLAEYAQVKVVNDCLCAAVYDAETGVVGQNVLEGLAGSRRDDLADCVLPALEDSRVSDEDRTALVRGLGALQAKGSYQALGTLVKAGKDPAVRAEAAKALRGSSTAVEILAGALTTDDDASVRAAAAAGLGGRRDDVAQDALRDAITTDADASVRAAAVEGLTHTSAQNDKALCAALGSDGDEGVRAAVVRNWKGTKRKRALECVEEHMKRVEASGAVRGAVLETLAASPSDYAADLLCRHIPTWVRHYIVDQIHVDVTGADIVKAQNDRDFERSYECVQRALRKGGYSCYGKNYLGHWMRELGGSAPTPWCPGMVRN